MAEEESASTSYTEDDFYCPICQEVFRTPVRVAACQHVFCRKCFLTAMKESRVHCPLCRGNVTRRERACPERALDLETIMRSFPGNCRCCSQRVELYRMRQHYKTCEKYQDEFGVSSTVPSFQLSPDTVANSNTDDQPTFDCPLCEEGNMTRQRLLDHCNTDHRGQVVPRHQFDYGDYVNLQLDEETQYQIAIEESFHVNI
ncbi:E3 ubiquitin-protein ligase RNF138 isoform X3 [Cricetulus griseus]|uniref:E3 ubiquitin-protein ligase RNF138 n=1 Tax=Cricetulus griseus TaxID=10029 RepID=A0A9J7K237_CRIGR|nr:E3 ubiquitin-protein ligase RNF138 isoform X3 [Cricetulus griseus]XP_035317735.1 E3 ubiquitin-protein ligase RNF138 isoform X3 [Cricetulus griseus]